MVTLAALDSPSSRGACSLASPPPARCFPVMETSRQDPVSLEECLAHDGLGVDGCDTGTCQTSNRHGCLEAGPWRSEEWPQLMWRGQPTPSPPHPTSSHVDSRPREDPPPLPPDPPPPFTGSPPQGNPNPKTTNPTCSLSKVQHHTTPTPIPNSLGGFDLSHLWGRSFQAGNSEVISIPVERRRNPDFQPRAVPLRGTGDSWSTLGGDSRSFVQVVQSPPRSRKMDNRFHGRHRQFMGDNREGRDARGHGGFEPSTGQRPGFRQWDSRRGNFRGARPPHQQWRQREYDRQFNQNPNREQHFDLRQNLKQNMEPKNKEEEKQQQQ